MYVYRSDNDGLAYAPEELLDFESLLKPERQVGLASATSKATVTNRDADRRSRLAVQQYSKPPGARASKVFSLQASALYDTSLNDCDNHRQQTSHHVPSAVR